MNEHGQCRLPHQLILSRTDCRPLAQPKSNTSARPASMGTILQAICTLPFPVFSQITPILPFFLLLGPPQIPDNETNDAKRIDSLLPKHKDRFPLKRRNA